MTLRDRPQAVLRLLTRRTPRQLTKGFPPMDGTFLVPKGKRLCRLSLA